MADGGAELQDAVVDALIAACEAAQPPPKVAGQRRKSFGIPGLQKAILAVPGVLQTFPQLVALGEALDGPAFRRIAAGAVRAAFLIEVVELPGTETTHTRLRWDEDRLAGDPRFAHPTACVAAFAEILTMLADLASSETGRAELESLAQHPKVEHEIPVDYADRPGPGEAIHRADNLTLVNGELLRRVTGLRLLLLDRDAPHRQVFDAAYEKLATKTYNTDRVQTGNHQTNREKRWEAHPDSVHFAFRRACLLIELALIDQLCHFEGFPAELAAMLRAEGLLSELDEPYRCPVTLDPLSWNDFRDQVLSPQAGRSSFHVGHVDPLKLEGNTWADGHRADNIAWMSADGNRIQGSLSVDETRVMLERVWSNYREAGLLDL